MVASHDRRSHPVGRAETNDRLLKRRLTPKPVPFALCFVLTGFTAAVIWSSLIHAPASDEPALLASGIVHWKYACFAPYRVNPPTVRMVAALPALWHPAAPAVGPRMEGPRPEATALQQLRSALAEGEIVRLVMLGRLMALPLVLPGVLVAYLWGRQLGGTSAGLFAASLLALSPGLLNAGSQIRSDAAAASMGLCAMFAWYCWYRQPSWKRSVLAGCTLGLALLCKLTMILLFVPTACLGICCIARKPRRRTLRRATQVCTAVLVALTVLNAGYAFQGTGIRLNEISFYSDTFRQIVSTLESSPFLAWLVEVPLFVPKDYLLGMDVQQVDFERGHWTFFGGTWWFTAPPYVYVLLVAAKEPLVHLIALVVAVGLLLRCRRIGSGELLALWLPGALLFAVVIAKSSLVYFRYVLPALAFLYVAAGIRIGTIKSRWWRLCWCVALLYTTVSLRNVAPHWESYASELIGGPRRAHWYLATGDALAANQDLLAVARWLQAHPECNPDGLAVGSERHRRQFRVLRRIPPPPVGPTGPPARYLADRGPKPGTYIVSLPVLVRRDAAWAYFRYVEPELYITPTVALYRLSQDDVEIVLRRMQVGGRGIDQAAIRSTQPLATRREPSPPSVEGGVLKHSSVSTRLRGQRNPHGSVIRRPRAEVHPHNEQRRHGRSTRA